MPERAVGSEEDSARRLGIKLNRTVVFGYAVCSLFVFLGAVVLLAQLGIGDPAQGLGYTLSSVTAVVLGGTSLLGGRGTVIGTLFGAFLIVQVQNATVFLGLSQPWQFFFQGVLIMAAAIVRKLLKRVVPRPGTGPSPEAQAAGFFDLRFFGETVAGDTVATKVVGDRDPGYGSTAKMIGEAALAFDLDHDTAQSGFHTPTTAFGDSLIDRLVEHAGLTLEVVG